MIKNFNIGIAFIVIFGAFALGLTVRNYPRIIKTETLISKTTKTESPISHGAIQYNCELSGGTFKNGRCACILEGEQTQEEMYYKRTGFCQSTIGGPAGDAFNASIGLPYGDYSYWTPIIMKLCTDSGGSISGAACICPTEKTYDKTDGKCK